MTRLTERTFTLAVSGTLLATVAVCGLGLHLTRLEYRNVSGILLDLDLGSAEAARGALESFLDGKEAAVLEALAAAGPEPEALAAAVKEPFAGHPFLFLADETLVTPVLGSRRGGPDEDDGPPPPELERAYRLLWSSAPPGEQARAFDEACAARDLPPALRLRARAAALALQVRSGAAGAASRGYEAVFAELSQPLQAGSRPSYLQLAAARLECLLAADAGEAARRHSIEVLEGLRQNGVARGLEEEVLFLHRARRVFAETGGGAPPILADLERDVEDRRLSLAVTESLRDWIFAQSRIAGPASQEGRPRQYIHLPAPGAEPVVVVWTRFTPLASGPPVTAVGFRIRPASLEETLNGFLASMRRGGRLAARVFPAKDDADFVALGALGGERGFIRVGLDRRIRDEREGPARQPFVFAGALIVLLMVLLVVGFVVLLRGIRREMALSRMKTEFVANVSHELKTPLALIRLFGETLLLDRVSEPDQRRKYYQIITRESERLAHLISNVLNFASIEAGKKSYELKAADIGSIVRGTYETYCFHLDEKGFRHSLAVAPGLPAVMADADAVAQALINLVENAVKYSKDERREISVEVFGQGDVVKVRVADRGIGIASDDQARVFEDYYRTREARALGTRGSGLGLSLVRHILAAHGGRVELESVPGEGSAFTLVFPAASGG